jgi:hypothetical protein
MCQIVLQNWTAVEIAVLGTQGKHIFLRHQWEATGKLKSIPAKHQSTAGRSQIIALSNICAKTGQYLLPNDCA